MTIALLFAAAAAAPFPAFADLAALDRQVAQFTGAPAGAEGGAVAPLDRRLRLRPCISPVALSWRGAARETVVAACPDAGGWRLFVPIRAGAPGQSQPPAINRGDAVTVAVTGAGFSVSQPAEALEAGPVGGWIRVRGTNGKNQIMRAQVLRPGLVGVPLP